MLGNRQPHLLGWSFGGLVAWELARQIEACGGVVASLTLLDSLPPGASPYRAELRDTELLDWFAMELADLLRVDVASDREAFESMPMEQRWAHLSKRLNIAGSARGELEVSFTARLGQSSCSTGDRRGAAAPGLCARRKAVGEIYDKRG
jgi:thioesterase domain-containing protein